MFSGVTTSIKTFDTAFLIVLAICTALLILVTGLMLLFTFKYNRKRHPKPRDVQDNLALEITWTVIPVILVLIIFLYGWEGYKQYLYVPDDAFAVKVYGMMWEWQYEYPNGARTKDLYVPKDQAVKLIIRSQDVLHSFYVPAFRIKQDALPNMTTKLWFEASKIGEFDVFCAEYCGLKHADMISKVIVLEQDAFNTWYDQAAVKDPPEETPVPARNGDAGSAPSGPTGTPAGGPATEVQ